MKSCLFFQPSVVLVSFCLLFSGCAVLTDTQVKNINAFSATTKEYSAFPSAIVRQYAGLHQSLEILNASELTDSTMIDRQLERARRTYASNLRVSDEFDLSLRIIQKYALLLTQLSSDRYTSGLDTATSALGGNLDSLVSVFDAKTGASIAVGVGDDLSKLILLAGKALTKRKQTQALKDFILEMDPVLQVVIQKLVDALDVGMKGLISLDQDGFRSDARNMLWSDSSIGFTIRGFRLRKYEAIEFYNNGINNYLATEMLRMQVVKAATSLGKAHAALAVNVKTKQPQPSLIAETKQLITDVQPLGDILSHYIKLP